MFRGRSRLTILAVMAVALVVPTGTALADGPPGHPVQLELGDSWTYGDGASSPSTTGYAGLVYAANQTAYNCSPAQSESAAGGCKHLQQVTLARPGTAQNPGVTTDALIAEQLDIATDLLTERNSDQNPHNDVEVVLVSVGGNDVSGPVLGACLEGLSPECVGVIHERLSHVGENLDFILGELRAAGPDAVIVITTYDNAIAFCPIGQIPGAAQLGAIVLEGFAPAGITGLNNEIREAAANHGVEVANTFGRLGSGEWVGDCLHPNDAGYAEIASVVNQTIKG